MIRLWLIGTDISASPSPAMHRAALAAAGVRGSYEAREIPSEGLAELVAEMRSGKAAGANVTMPFKVTLAAECDVLEGDAAVLGAVNTVTREGEALIGDNTDARGFEMALRTDGLWPAGGCNAVVVGAGGAAAAIVLALSRIPAASITLVARRPDAGADVAGRLQPVTPVTVVPWSRPSVEAAARAADLIVNATPVGLAKMPFTIDRLKPRCAVIDIRYRPRPVDLAAAALDHGRPASDGLEMLLQQGMLSFTRWTGRQPPWREARAALRAAVGA